MSNEYDYMDAPDDMVDYLTAQVDASFARQEASYEKMREGSEKLLNMLLAGIGGSVMLLFNLTDANVKLSSVSIGIAAMIICWFFCAIYLLEKCIIAQQRPSLFSVPSALYFDDPRTGKKVTIDALKRYRLPQKVNDENLLTEINRTRA